ncbi:hypothetical protein TNCV_85101 [Trichonephila clavipes]|nr:hypothetical protein TNCV_85101 [Trichonephila clavipes]
MVLPAGQGQVPHPSIVPECFTINQLWNDRCTWPWGHCLLSELREWRLQTVLFEGDARNRWRDGPVCPAVDKELWRLGPDGSAVRSAGCKCLPFLLVKSAREVPAFRFFPEKDKEEVSSVFTCNVKCIMAFLLRERKDVLLEVAKELRVEIDITLPKIEFKKRICQSEDYNEESVKSLLEGILAEKQEARELKERQETREYELERLRLSNATETVSVSSADLEGQGVNRRVNLKDLVPKFDAKNADINLFFEIFERQAIKEKVAEDRWVSQLIPLLPIEIAEIVAKEPLEKSDDYPHIKNLLLVRFQLTPIALRDRFESHQRRPGAMWADLVFELRSYLDNWLAGMKVGDFAALKELLVTEQIKKRAPSELVDHFLDSWDGFKEAKSLAEKLDHFEAIRRVHKKTGPTKTWERRTFDKQPLESKNKSAHFSGKGKNIGLLNRDPYKHEGGEDDSFIIPAFEGEGGKSLAKVNGVEFKEEQRKCPDLKPLWDKAQTGIDKEFRVIRGKLESRKLSEGRRPELVSLVVEEVSDDIEGDAEIPYPDKQCTKFDYHEILRESQLQLKLSPSQIDELKQVITKNKDVFSPDPGTTHLMRMDIELISDKPIKTKPYRMSPRQINILREEIKRLLELGVIEIGQSDYTSPLILVESPNKDPRPCVDYRRLNEITRAEFFPLPNMEEIVEKVSAAPYVTVMDLSKGYFQIPLTPRAQRYVAFVTPFGTYIPKKMMFGLVCAPYYFCKLMAQVLEGLEQFALPYIDDIAIFKPRVERSRKAYRHSFRKIEKGGA